jgi:phage baseplate assembly protein W
MTGMNRYTGKPISGWDEVVQAIEVIMTTRLGERVLREWFGSSVPKLLGELGNEETFVRFYGAIVRSLTIKELNGWTREPRYRIVKFEVTSIDRQGAADITITGLYMPRALQGDLTPEGFRKITISGDGIRGVF